MATASMARRARTRSSRWSWRLSCGGSFRESALPAWSSRTPAARLTSRTVGSAGTVRGADAALSRITRSHTTSSTSRMTARAAVVRPEGRYGVARNVVRSLATAASARATALSTSSPGSPCRAATSASSRAASCRQASDAASRSGSLRGAGQSSVTAGRDTTPASSQPSIRSGIADAGAGVVTGRMKLSRIDVLAPARAELTTPANITTKPTTSIAAAASHAFLEPSVAGAMSTHPIATRKLCAASRSPSVPPKSASSSIANEPNAANVATSGFPMTWDPTANSAGMTIAVRAARRVARKPPSRASNQLRAPLTPSPSRPRHEAMLAYDVSLRLGGLRAPTGPAVLRHIASTCSVGRAGNSPNRAPVLRGEGRGAPRSPDSSRAGRPVGADPR